MSRQLPKILLIFNLENIFCKYNASKSFSIANALQPNTLHIRNQIGELCHFLFIRNKLFIKTAIWTTSTTERTDLLCKKVFSDYHKHLLFKYTSPNESAPIDLARIWHNFPEFSRKNVVYIDDKLTSATPESNVLLFPPYNDDSCLPLFQEYLRFFSYQYLDGRIDDMESFILRVKFCDFYMEKSKVYRGKPEGEARRFW